MSQFSNKTVLITGASGGLGQQLAVDFARDGARVAVNYSSSATAADETVARIREAGGQAMVCHADIACAEDVNAMVEKVVETSGESHERHGVSI